MQIQHALQLSKALLGSSFSGLEGLVDDLLPQSGGLLAVEQEFLPGKNSAKTKSWTLPRKKMQRPWLLHSYFKNGVLCNLHICCVAFVTLKLMDTNELVCLGMTCLVLAVLLEKVLSHVIVNQFALSISERTEEEEILLKRAMQEESLERLDLSSSSSSSHSRDESVAGACETLTAVPHARGGESQIPPESLVSTKKIKSIVP